MRIGIVGAGQLGQMLGFAATALGHECVFLDPADNPPAADAGEIIKAAFDDPAALHSLARSCDVISYEFENVPVEALRKIAGAIDVFPPLPALEQAQDRLVEKRLFESIDIALPAFRAIDSRDELLAAVEDLGLPIVVKTRRFGYDGKGQVVIRKREEIDDAWRQLGERPLIAEEWLAFDYEVSVIGARNAGGDVVVWPLSRNEHTDGILRVSTAPVDDDALATRAGDYIRRLLAHLDYVGVLALELFVAGDDLLANEYAPRVHNSGHWTIEAAETSQFSNHIHAITGERLGATNALAYAGMVNLIGSISPTTRKLSMPGTWLHDYGKAPRPGRKLGHVTTMSDTEAVRNEALRKILETVT